MTLNDAITIIRSEAKYRSYSDSEIEKIIPDVREMFYDVEDLTDEYVAQFVEDCL